MRHRFIGLVTAACLLLCTVGCKDNPDPTPTPTPTPTNQPDPTIVNDIQFGTASVVALALPLIKDQVTTKQAATLAKQTIDKDILPILNGDDAGLVAGLSDILALKAFNNPSLSKIKLIIQAALPMLLGHVDLNKVTGTVPPDIKAYLVAFFTGADTGLGNYLGTSVPAPTKKGAVPVISINELIDDLNK